MKVSMFGDWGSVRIGIFRIVSASVALVAGLLCIRPTTFSMPNGDLDSSWMESAVYAVNKGLVFGSEFVFTAGPLSSLYHRLYPHGQAPLIILLGVAWVAVMGVGFYKILVHRIDSEPRLASRLFCLAVLAAASLATVLRDSAATFIAFVVAMLFTWGAAGNVFMVSGVIVSAALALAKFSIFPFALPAFVITDVVSLVRRQLPYKTALFIVSMWILYVVAGQPFAAFPEYIRSSMEVSAAYTAAMSSQGFAGEWAAWIVCAILALATFIGVEYARHETGWAERFASVARVALVFGYLFVAFKAGFVRHDGHSLTAWTALVLASPILLLSARQSATRSSLLGLTAGVSLAGLLLITHGILASWRFVAPQEIALRTFQEVRSVAGFVLRPRFWVDYKEAQFAKAERRVASMMPLPVIKGAVDIIPSRQGALIAAGLDFVPRPTVQEYTTYSQALIDRNRQFYLSDRAPASILFAPSSIDGRHPASAEGTLWPLFLMMYKPGRRVGDLLLLEKRHHPIAQIIKQPVAVQASLGERIEVPSTGTPLFVTFDIRYTVLGRLSELLFKAPQLKLRATYSNGATEEFRLIPAMARAGEILVPTIRTSSAFYQLATGQDALARLQRPMAFEITADNGRWAYKENVGATFAEVDVGLLAKSREGGENASQSRADEFSGIDRLADANVMAPPMLERAQEGMFAHAPSRVYADVVGGSVITLGFGIRDGAWQQGDVKGVCFRAVTDAGTALLDRCLDPKAVDEDRGPQIAKVVIPNGVSQLVLMTDCIQAACNWAWSYWSRFDLASSRPANPR